MQTAPKRRIPIVRGLVLPCAFLLALGQGAGAVERPIPESAGVTTFARLQGEQLELLVRLPLVAVRDVQFPVRGEAGYLDLDGVKSMLTGIARYWVADHFEVWEHGRRLPRPEVAATRISISSDSSFASYQTAAARFDAPELARDADVFWEQVWLDVRLLYPLPSSASDAAPSLALEPSVASMAVRVTTAMTIVDANGQQRALTFEEDPGPIYLWPTLARSAGEFFWRGVRFVGTSADLLVFLFCLCLPFRSYRLFVPVFGALVAAFLLTSVAFATGVLLVGPAGRLAVAVLSALSVLLVACANIVGRVTPRGRAVFALGAGVIFGSAAALRLESAWQLAIPHPLGATLAYYGGGIAALACAAAMLIPVVTLMFSFTRAEMLERVVVSALAADTAWMWLDDRWAQFRRIPINLAFDAGGVSSNLKALALLVLLVGLAWLLNERLKRWTFGDRELVPRLSREPSA